MGGGGGQSSAEVGRMEATIFVERGADYFDQECSFQRSDVLYVCACDLCGVAKRLEKLQRDFL